MSDQKIIREGRGEVIYPAEGNPVFYNPVQCVNRDLSVLALNLYAEQIQAEADEFLVRREHKTGKWRKKLPTWNTWGSTLTDEEKALGKVPPREDEGASVAGLHVLEALSATGLRSMRYAQEVVDGVGIERILVNDLEEHAVEMIKANVEHNKLDASRIVPTQSDATMTMYKHRANDSKSRKAAGIGRGIDGMTEEALGSEPFDVIDLDPYGAPTPFLDAAVQSVEVGGMLAVTATDLTVLCGNNSEVCYAKYGCMPLKGKFCHEMAVRMVLASIERHANRYGRYIVPLLSVRIDFYLRVFVRVYASKEEIKKTPSKLAYVVKAKGCDSFHLDPVGSAVTPSSSSTTKYVPGIRDPSSSGGTCPDSGCRWSVGGPIWTAPMYNEAFVKAAIGKLESIERDDSTSATTGPLLKQSRRVLGLLTAVSEELRDVPLFYTLPSLSKTLTCSSPPREAFEAALDNLGYRVSQSHCTGDALKTDAPTTVVWDVMRAWVKKHPVNQKGKGKNRNKKGDEIATPGDNILAQEPSASIDFTPSKKIAAKYAAKRNKRLPNGKKRVAKWAANPEKNWGPKRAALGKGDRQTHRRTKNRADQKD